MNGLEKSIIKELSANLTESTKTDWAPGFGTINNWDIHVKKMKTVIQNSVSILNVLSSRNNEEEPNLDSFQFICSTFDKDMKLIDSWNRAYSRDFLLRCNIQSDFLKQSKNSISEPYVGSYKGKVIHIRVVRF